MSANNVKKDCFLVEIESEHGIDAETLQSNIYYRFPTSVESVKVEAAAELLKLREEIRTLKELLYEAQQINMLSDGEGGGAWSVNGDLEERIDKALEGYQIED